MKFSLTQKVVGFITLIVLAISMSSTAFFYFTYQKGVLKEITVRGTTMAESLSRAVAEGLASENLGIIKQVQSIAQTGDVILAQVYSSEWQPIDSYPSDTFGIPPDPAALTTDKSRDAVFYLQNKDNIDFYSPVYYHRFEKAPDKKYLIGHVRLKLSTHQVRQVILHRIGVYFFCSSLFGFFTILILSKFIHRVVLDPIRQLNLAVSYAVNNGSFLTVSVSSDDEIGELTQNYNAMSSAIQERERKLRLSEERFSTAFRVSPDAIAINNIDSGVYQEINEGFSAISGYLPEDILGRSSLELDIWVASGERDSFSAILKQNGCVNNFEAPFRRKDGSTLVGLMSARVIEIGGETCLLSITRDITEQKTSEETIRKSEDKFSKAFNACPEAISITSLVDGRYVEVNDVFLKTTGFERSEVIGHSSIELNVWIDNTERQHFYDKISQSGSIKNMEITFRMKNEEQRHFIVSSEVVEISGALCSLNFIIDITERKRAEELLSYTLSLTDAALDATADGILIVDKNGNIARWNQKFVNLWQIPEKLLKTGATEQLQGEIAAQMAQPEEFLARVSELYRQPENASLDLLNLADGRLIERYSQPQRIGNEIVGRFWSFRDLTEQKRHENEVLKISKLESLGVLAGGIAHDFNNILAGIMGNISFAQVFLDAAHKSYRPLVEAEKASARATELAHQLLTFARGGEPMKKTVSLQILVEEATSLVLHGSNVKGCVHVSDAIHAVKADEGQLSQVFHNIIINAIQAMPGGGTLEVTAQNRHLDASNTMNLPAGDYVRIHFTDQGCGISDADLAKIFDPYFTTKSAGNGLGLASTHSIIRKHGGHIEASSAIGKGTTFSIHLPSLGRTAEPQLTDAPFQGSQQRIGWSILVMDDEELIRDMLSDMLKHLGCRVMTCVDGAEAISRYEASLASDTPFSAVIMDLTIPGGMGGKDAAARILALDPDACLIVSSGYSTDPVMSDFSTYGFCGAVAKPYNIESLGRQLRSILPARQY